MCLNASTIASDLSERLNIKDHALAHSVWFQLLTNEQYYKSCQQVNNFAFRFLNRSLNEAVVEVEVSNLKETSSDKRKLLQKTQKCLILSQPTAHTRHIKHNIMYKDSLTPAIVYGCGGQLFKPPFWERLAFHHQQ